MGAQTGAAIDLVSGSLSRLSPPGRIVDRLDDDTLVPLYDTRILAEDETGLCRPRFHFTHAIVTAILENVPLSGIPIAARPLSGVTLADLIDPPFLEVAAAGAADYVVTGNTSHRALIGSHSVRVISPRQYVELLDRATDPR